MQESFPQLLYLKKTNLVFQTRTLTSSYIEKLLSQMKKRVPVTETRLGAIVTNTKKHPSDKDVTSKACLAFRSIAKTLAANQD